MMRDKYWARKEVDRYLSYEGVNEARNALAFAKGVIDQLEEPEKPVIPKFVADWIERYKHMKLETVMELFNEVYYEESDDDDDEKLRNKVFEWVMEGENDEMLALAWILDDYEVEKEKLYYLRLRDKDLPLYKAYDMKRCKYKLVYSAHHLHNENFLTVTFSESEIENMDIRSFELEEVTE